MKILYKMIEHERTEDAPFVGALICAKGCHNKCKGCFNRSLKKLPNVHATAPEIVAEVLSNPLNEGIIFGGLEWSEQPLELLAVIEEASKYGLKIMIYTGLDILDFQCVIGKACGKEKKFDEEYAKKMLMGSDTQLYAMIGAMMLDYYIEDTYYLKCGKYDREKLVDDRVQFGVTLASENQMMYKIQKQEVQTPEGFELEIEPE